MFSSNAKELFKGKSLAAMRSIQCSLSICMHFIALGPSLLWLRRTRKLGDNPPSVPSASDDGVFVEGRSSALRRDDVLDVFQSMTWSHLSSAADGSYAKLVRTTRSADASPSRNDLRAQSAANSHAPMNDRGKPFSNPGSPLSNPNVWEAEKKDRARFLNAVCSSIGLSLPRMNHLLLLAHRCLVVCFTRCSAEQRSRHAAPLVSALKKSAERCRWMLAQRADLHSNPLMQESLPPREPGLGETLYLEGALMQCEACIDFINANAYGDSGNADGLGKVAPSPDDMFASGRGCRRRTWIEGPPPPIAKDAADFSSKSATNSKALKEETESSKLFDDIGELWEARAVDEESIDPSQEKQMHFQINDEEWMETGIGCRLTTVITSPEGYAKIITRTSTEVSHDIVRVPTMLRPVGAPEDIAYYVHDATERRFLASALKRARMEPPRRSPNATPPSPGSPLSPCPSVARTGTGSEAELRTQLIARSLASTSSSLGAAPNFTAASLNTSVPKRTLLEKRMGGSGSGFSPVSSPKSSRRKLSRLLERRPKAKAAAAAANDADGLGARDGALFIESQPTRKGSYLSLALNLNETSDNLKYRYLKTKHSTLFESSAHIRRQRKPRRQRAFTESDLEAENAERQIQAPLQFTAVPPLPQTDAVLANSVNVTVAGQKLGRFRGDGEKAILTNTGTDHGQLTGVAAIDPGFVFMRQRKWAPPTTIVGGGASSSAPPREIDEDSAAFRRALAVLDRTPYAFSTHRIAILYVPAGGNSSEREVLSNRNG